MALARSRKLWPSPVLRKTKPRTEPISAPHLLVGLLEGAVVGQVELGDAGGIGRAAQILQHHGIIEIVPRRAHDAERVGKAHGDPGAAQRVTLGLALGQVQRMLNAPSRSDNDAVRAALEGAMLALMVR